MKVSIVMPVSHYNGSIRMSIDSILRQSFRDIELIIVSRDTKYMNRLLSSYEDDRIVHVKSLMNNHFIRDGISIAKGKYICFTSSSTISVQDRIEKQFNFMEQNTSIGVSGTDPCSCLSDSEIIKVLYLNHPVIRWESLIFRKKTITFDVIDCKYKNIYYAMFSLVVKVLHRNDIAVIKQPLIATYDRAFYASPKEQDSIKLDQIHQLGVMMTKKQSEIHLSLMSRTSEMGFILSEYEEWVKFILKVNNSHYNDDYLHSYLNSKLIEKNIAVNLKPQIKSSKKPAIRILVVCPNLAIINPFISILINEINSHEYIVDYSIKAFLDQEEDYDIIHFHWPELIFNWRTPTDTDITYLKDVLHNWKLKGAKIVFTRHDEDTHYSQKGNATSQMFDAVLSYSDTIVHLGKYSQQRVMNKLGISGQQNIIIPHNIYDTIYSNNISKGVARNFLGINKKSLVILAFGYFRANEEYYMVKDMFEQLDVPNKFLLAPSWNNNIISIEGDCFLGNGRVDADMLPYCFTAADIVFIQRVKILNSGNLPMAFFFNKIVVGPNIGNVGEYLDNVTNFSFDPYDAKTIHKALKKAIVRLNNGVEVDNEKYAHEHWSTKKICNMYKALYAKLCE